MTREISDLNLDIASAHIATFGEKAVDVFYVTDLTGKKITELEPRERAIRERLDQGARAAAARRRCSRLETPSPSAHQCMTAVSRLRHRRRDDHPEPRARLRARRADRRRARRRLRRRRLLRRLPRSPTVPPPVRRRAPSTRPSCRSSPSACMAKGKACGAGFCRAGARPPHPRARWRSRFWPSSPCPG